MEEKYEFEFEPSKPIDGQKGVTFTSTVTPQSEEKSDTLSFSPANKIAQTMMAPMKDAADKVVAVGGGAAIGTVSRMKEIRDLFSRLVSSGMEPNQAAELASKQVLTEAPVEAMRPGAQPAGATSAQIMEKGKMTSGDKWAAKIGGPGGETAEQAYENFRRRKTLGAGETLLRSGIALPAGSNVRGAPPATIPNVLQEEAVANAAREAAAAKGASKTGVFGNWAASTPGIVGKLLGGVGGAAAGYQGYEAYKAMKAAENNPERLQAILDMLAAGASGAAALPIPAAQLPGLALGIGIPAAGYLGRKISGALPDFGISEEAKRAVR
tara:strand:+ start:12026 stop:13000 length:975 start_codon:yes stop_codon:yes gene_type:complete